MTTNDSLTANEFINALYDYGVSYNVMARLAQVTVAVIKSVKREQSEIDLSAQAHTALSNHLDFLRSFGDDLEKADYYEDHLVLFAFGKELYSVYLHDLVELDLWSGGFAKAYITSVTSITNFASLMDEYPELYDFQLVDANDGHKSIVMNSIHRIERNQIFEMLPKLTFVK